MGRPSAWWSSNWTRRSMTRESKAMAEPSLPRLNLFVGAVAVERRVDARSCFDPTPLHGLDRNARNRGGFGVLVSVIEDQVKRLAQFVRQRFHRIVPRGQLFWVVQGINRGMTR